MKCDDGNICSMHVGVTVFDTIEFQSAANTLLANCHDILLSTKKSCSALNQGGQTVCSVPGPNGVIGSLGKMTYWYRGLKGADWGIACKNQAGFTSLKCGHMTCHKTAMKCDWS